MKICDLHVTSEETKMTDRVATHSNPGARGGASEMSLAAVSSRPWEAHEEGEDQPLAVWRISVQYLYSVFVTWNTAVSVT